MSNPTGREGDDLRLLKSDGRIFQNLVIDDSISFQKYMYYNIVLNIEDIKFS